MLGLPKGWDMQPGGALVSSLQRANAIRSRQPGVLSTNTHFPDHAQSCLGGLAAPQLPHAQEHRFRLVNVLSLAWSWGKVAETMQEY